MFSQDVGPMEPGPFDAFLEETAAILRNRVNPMLAAPLIAERLRRLTRRHRWLPPGCANATGDSCTSHVLHVADDGAFSVVALVLRPGEKTAVHDHDAWCVGSVYEGTVIEERYELRRDPRGDHLVATSNRTLRERDVAITLDHDAVHSLLNPTDARAICVHVYGTDVLMKHPIRGRYDDLPVV